MNKRLILALLLALGLIISTLAEQADARRLGGGRSFGSKPGYSQKFQKSTPASPTQQAAPTNAPMGGRGMFGGMFGGMLMGGLLGSLFFGGAFSGLRFMDILIIGGGMYLLFKFLRSRQPALQNAGRSSTQATPNSWTHLRSTQSDGVNHGPSVPPGFDTEEFLQGAKVAYVRMQGSWDKRDLEDLRQFTSAEFFAEIQSQAASDPGPGTTEILLLEAQLLEVKATGNQTIATVLFDTMLREDSASAPAEQVREAWHFSRYETGGQTHWVVEGIQQLAS